MSKSKMILAGISGTIGLIVLVLAFLVWQAYSGKSKATEGDDEEGTDGLETVIVRAETASRKSVYPCAASVKAIEENLATVDAWCKKGLKFASRGDRTFPKTTPAQFKTDIVNEAKRLMSLPGGVDGKLVKPDFSFGPFKDYIVEGKMPSETTLAGLQRQWEDMSRIMEMFSATGVTEVIDVQVRVGAETDGKDGKDGKGSRSKGDKRKRKSSPEVSSLVPKPSSCTYVIVFAAKPWAFVNVLNGFSASERFVVVDDFAFAHQGDSIVDALGEDEKKPGAQQTSGGRRSGRRRGGRRGSEETSAAKTQDQEKHAANDGIVADPKNDTLLATMTVTVHDFRSLEEAENGGAESLPLQKGDSK